MYTLIYQDAVSRTCYDISSLASNIEHHTEMDSQPGKLTFKLSEDPKKLLNKIKMGSVIILKSTLKILFRGRVFRAETDENGGWQVTAYDSLRYLKNKDTMSCINKTLQEFVQDIANAANISCKVSAGGSVKLTDRLFQSKSYFEMLKTCFDEVFEKNGTLLFMRDNNGILEVTEPKKCVTSNYVGDGANLTGYSYSEDIDETTFNKIMLFKKDKKTGQLKMLDPQQDFMTATLWGVLQDEKTFDENTEDSQAIAYGQLLLANKNRIKNSISIKALNIDGLDAGCGFYFVLSKLNIMQSVYVTRATHYYNQDLGTMDLEVSLIV